ncbi:hypothetical protein [uncultured Pseudoteredinibacter sp.]|uniref:hypothetical protein n=1 Tax=uncultured Pseudoteredinibacter sp. TaxID=1641701 RepID=UPI0026056FA1|nr:hypothetical protein [uncultured Pseudoteredinibacter sp.]
MARKSTLLTPLLIAATATCLVACDGYRLSINEQAIGPEREVFRAYDIPDKNLRNCVSQRIHDEQIQHAGQLDYLNCSHGDIAELTGLAIFVSLAQIDLSSNQIRDIGELNRLPQLKEVNLDKNSALDCAQVAALRAKQEVEVKAKSCR